jgi:anti-sigma factor RsiW
MDHESAVERLHDLQVGDLDDAARSELDGHLAQCSDCRSLADTYRDLYAMFEARDERDGAHPNPAEIVSRVYVPERMAAADREAIDAHVEQCDQCKAEVDRVRLVEESFAGGKPPRSEGRRWGTRPALALAASVVLAALIYPAFLGLIRLPQVQRSLDGARQDRDSLEEMVAGLTQWSGATPMQFVTSARRQDAAPTQILVREAQPYVILGVDVGIPPELSDAERLSLAILDRTGQVTKDVRLTVGEARSQILATGVITVVLPSASLPPATYEMRVGVVGRDDVQPFLEASLEVKHAEP